MAKKQPLDHLRKKKPIGTTVIVPLEDGLTDLVQEARDEVGRALLLENEERLSAAREKLAAAEAHLRENSVIFDFRALGRTAFDKLINEHPPTKEQLAEDDTASWNPDTFVPALISATLADPELTPAEVKDEILDSDNWGAAEVKQLFDTALAVCSARRIAQLGN